MSRWSCTRSLCCRCGPLARYEIYSREVWASSMIRNLRLWGPLGLHHCPALCGSHHHVWVREELPWGEDPQCGFKHSPGLKDGAYCECCCSSRDPEELSDKLKLPDNFQWSLERSTPKFRIIRSWECFTLLLFPFKWGKGCQEILLPD